ncbi:nucleolar protein 11-like [Physella acuta]|uniref:nucleolar protein 11-like n=1 Tax=Physella acuta TaxID=109671 RepID=UPI0027DC696D|nr:nucleolar protein 11-like [Physella acuta]
MSVNDKQAVECCIQDGDLSKLLRLPQNLDDFSEACIIKSVDWILQLNEQQIEEGTKDLQEADIEAGVPWAQHSVKSPFTNRKCFILNGMMSRKFSPQFLQEEVRAMSFDSVLILIQYLQFLLMWSSVQEDDQPIPSLEQVIHWLNALIDSHFQQLKLAEDADEVIVSLHQQITHMAHWQQECKALQGMLAELNRKFEEQQKSTKIGDYCIEVISF